MKREDASLLVYYDVSLTNIGNDVSERSVFETSITICQQTCPENQ
jgi:hypothetical protein